MPFATPEDCKRVGKHWINIESGTCYRCGSKITNEVINEEVIEKPTEAPKVEKPKEEQVLVKTFDSPKTAKQEKKEKPKKKLKKFNK